MKNRLIPALLAAAVALAAAAPATATISPRNCGPLRVDGKRYTVKSHLLTCRKAKPWAKTYLDTGRRPTGWSCRKFPRRSSFAFLCRRGDMDFYALRR